MKTKTHLFISLGFLVAMVAIGVVFYSSGSIFAQFGGPSGPAGTGTGAISTDSSRNLSIGTTTVLSDTRLFILGSTSADDKFAIQLKNKEGRPLFVLRNDGRIVVGPFPVGNPPTFPSAATLQVRGLIETINSTDPVLGGGIRFPDGTTQITAATGGGVTSTPAGYVTPGQFNSIAGTGGNYSFPASLGVGSSTISYRLHVTDNTAGPSLGIRNLHASGYPGIEYADNAGVVNTYIGYDNVNDQTRINSLNNKPIRILTNSTDALFIDSSQRIGLGTTTPSVGLHMRSSQLAANSGILFEHANGTQGIKIGYSGITKSTTNGFNDVWVDAASTGHVLLNSNGGSGNVGIGITIPTAKLHVIGGAKIGTSGYVALTGDIGVSRDSSPGTGVIYLGNSGTRYLYYDGASYQMPGAGLTVGGALTVAGKVQSVSTPTVSTDAATKGYVDSVVGAQYMGITGTTYTGNLGGVLGANAKCNSHYSGSHMCTQAEIIRSGITSVTAANGWISCDLVNGEETCLGPSYSHTPNLSEGGATCVQWTNGTGSYSGPYLVWTNGSVQTVTCNASQGIHCCK